MPYFNDLPATANLYRRDKNENDKEADFLISPLFRVKTILHERNNGRMTITSPECVQHEACSLGWESPCSRSHWSSDFCWAQLVKKNLPVDTETYYFCLRLHAGATEVKPLGTTVLKAKSVPWSSNITLSHITEHWYCSLIKTSVRTGEKQLWWWDYKKRIMLHCKQKCFNRKKKHEQGGIW